MDVPLVKPIYHMDVSRTFLYRDKYIDIKLYRDFYIDINEKVYVIM